VKRLRDGSGKGRVMAGIAVTAALLVPLAIFGAPAFAKSGAAAGPNGSGSSQYQYRVTICHLTGSKKHPAHTITVSSASVTQHLAHGDHLGPCTGTEKPKPTGKGHSTNSGQTTNAATHGKGHHK
jgi:hypothetical protein